MPFIPELFSAPALERIEERRQGRLAGVPFFDGLIRHYGDADPALGRHLDDRSLTDQTNVVASR